MKAIQNRERQVQYFKHKNASLDGLLASIVAGTSGPMKTASGARTREKVAAEIIARGFSAGVNAVAAGMQKRASGWGDWRALFGMGAGAAGGGASLAGQVIQHAPSILGGAALGAGVGALSARRGKKMKGALLGGLLGGVAAPVASHFGQKFQMRPPAGQALLDTAAAEGAFEWKDLPKNLQRGAGTEAGNLAIKKYLSPSGFLPKSVATPILPTLATIGAGIGAGAYLNRSAAQEAKELARLRRRRNQMRLEAGPAQFGF